MDQTVPRQSQAQSDYIQNWQMPAIEVGEPILWFGSYTNPNSKCHAFVTRVSQRSVECRVASGEHSDHRFDVLHRDDPRLLINVNMQRNGCWEYAPISARVRMLEQDVDELRILLSRTADFKAAAAANKEGINSARSQRAKEIWRKRREAKQETASATE